MNSRKIIKAMEKATGQKAQPVTVKMRGVRELRSWLKGFFKAQKDSGKSTTRYGEETTEQVRNNYEA